MKKCIVLFSFIVLTFSALAQIPSGYYTNALGKTGDTLRAALRDIISTGHVKLPYTSGTFDVWDAYARTDVRPNDTTIIWDMYSDIPNGTNYTFTIYTDQCGTTNAEGGCYAREHMVPNSWWGGFDNLSNPQYTDLHHLCPADQYVNNKKSAHPLGDITTPTWTSSNGSKLGPCSTLGYTGTVFEPINDYKGDFARAYLYIATRYMNNLSNWVNTYPNTEAQHVISSTDNNFKPWFIDMLITWHNNDPVSSKEVNRNNAIYYRTPQHNRNPFVDHPEYVCQIWATTSCTTAPSITNILNTPTYPISTNTVAVTANVTDDDSVISVTLQWCTDGTSFGNSIPMHVTTAPGYHTNSSIPTQPSETTVYYRIVAVDNDSNTTTSPVHTYTVLKNQPTNHATAFSCGTTTNSSITLTWTDATGAVIPDGYLIKMSTVSFTDISTPVDQVPEPNSTFVRNVAHGVQHCTFTGLSQSSTYYFKIFPYTNPLSRINYKPSGTIPSTNCTTTAKVGCATDLLISEYMEGSSNNKYIEIYNNTGDSVDLSNYKLQLFGNGSSTPTNNVTLSGILSNQTAIVYKNSSATVYSGAATNISAVNFNGDDAIALYKISDSSYVDIFGRIGEDPGTAWTSGAYSTLDHTLVRNTSVKSGITINPTSGFPTLSTEWTQYNLDDVSYLGTHTMNCPPTCISPTLSAGNISFTSVGETSATIQWDNGNGSKRIVVAKEEGIISGTPSNESTYTANPVFGSGNTLENGEYIVYNDSGSAVTVSNLTAGLTYYFTIFEYNCAPGSEIYLTPGTSGSQITYSLTTGATTDNSFCISPTTGVSTSILIISTGSFNSNTYTAQLSDSLGSFANPVNIGTTVSNSNNEAINCTIPANTPSGTGYRIRVISSSPSLTGTSTDPFQIIVNASPTGTASQIFCNSAKIADLTTTSGSDILWYATADGGTSLDTSIALTTATHYFATQTVGSCESPVRLDVTATINAPTAPTGTASQTFCNAATIADLTATGNSIKWYAAASGGTALASTTALANNTHYYASQTVNGCESAARLDVTVTINTPVAPTGTASQTFCNSATVANLTATGSSIKWYAASTGGTNLASSTALANNTHYYASQTINGCESASRLDVTVTINAPVAPTGTASQTFCNSATVTNLTATGNSIKWYAAATGGNAFASSTALVNNTHYYASQTVSSCESASRLDVIVTISTPVAPTGTASQTFCNSGTVAGLTATGNSIQWYTAASGGTAFASSTALVNNTHYYASQTVNGCESAARLDVTVTINAPVAPTGTASQTFCNSATIANLTATGSSIKWYAASTGGTNLASSTALANNTHYYASQTVNGCESAVRLDVTVTINVPTAPTGTALQTFCNSAIIANLTASGSSIKWYATASGGTTLASTTALANNTHYYASQTVNGCESAARLDVTVTINAPVAPTGTASQTFCNSGTVAGLTATGTSIQWYAAASGGIALASTTALANNTHYYASQTVSGCESAARLDITATINAPTAPTGTASQTFCNAATIADLTATGNSIKWYAAASGGTALASSTALANNTHYYASQTVNGCESTPRLDVTVTINAPTAPTGIASQTFCNTTTVTNLTATGNSIKWYAAATGGNALASTTALVNNTHYYASQTVSGCESAARLDVTATINSPAAPTGTTSQTFCNTGTVAGLTATGTSIQWYAASSGGTALASTTALANNTHYYASQTVNGCESAARLDVTVTINAPVAPTGTASQTFCNSGTVAGLTATGTSIQWYAAASGGIALASTTALANNTHYYASQTVSGCESAARLDITATINAPTAPTGTASQTFCNAATIADLTATGNSIKWYAAASGGTALASTTALANNTHYYASQTVNGCESAARLDVTVTINAPAAPTGTASQTFCNSATVTNLTATGNSIKWYAAASGGTALASSTALANNTHYYASQTVNGCESASRLDVTVTINAPVAPTGTASQTFCNSATVTNLTATGNSIKWYAAASGGTALALTTALANNTHYYASQTVNGCESASRLDVTATINVPVAPTGATSQTFCNAATVTNLTATGSSIKWYAAASGGTAFASSTALANNTHYYASQTVNGCESASRLDVTVTINAPVAPTGTASQTFCNSATVTNLTATGNSIQWYAAASGGTALASTTAIVNNTHYYASQTVSGCESVLRFDVTVTINAPTAPTGIASQTFCNTATVTNLTATGSSIKWYAAASGGTAFASTTALVNNTHYYASQTVNGCESAARLDVSAIINIISAPTGDTVQPFCGTNHQVSELIAMGNNITWYSDSIGGTVLSNNDTLINGNYYIATQTVNSCESIDMLTIQTIIHPLPQVSVQPTTPVCYTSSGYVLTGGTPENGTYSGNNVINDTLYATAPNTTETITYTVTDSNNCTSSASIAIDIEICTNIENSSQEQDIIHVFPNPNSGIFNIVLKNKNTHLLHIKLYNIHGQVIFNIQEYNIAANSTKLVQLNDLQKGIYLLEVKTEYGIQTCKVVIQ